MPRFKYSAMLESGRRATGTLRSHSRREAIRELLSRGYHPTSLTAAQSGNPTVKETSYRLFRRISTSDLAVFTRQMASLLRAGLTVHQALSTVRRQCQNKHLSTLTEEIEDTLSREGVTLAQALENHPEVFDTVYCGLVRAGEEGGNLAQVLNELAHYLAQSARLKGQVLGAFVYPILLLVLGIAAVLVLMTFVIPRFDELFRSFGQQLPWPTLALMAVSRFLAHWWWATLVAGGVGLLLCLRVLRRTAARQRSHGILLRVPLFGSMILKLEISRISHTLGTLLRNGVSILEALQVTANTVRNLALRSTFEGLIKGVSQGQGLADAVEKAKAYPPLVVNLIRTGEDSGELPQMLAELSDIYDDESERAVSAAVKLLEPLLIVILGGIIASIVAAVMLPIFQASAMVE